MVCLCLPWLQPQMALLSPLFPLSATSNSLVQLGLPCLFFTSFCHHPSPATIIASIAPCNGLLPAFSPLVLTPPVHSPPNSCHDLNNHHHNTGRPCSNSSTALRGTGLGLASACWPQSCSCHFRRAGLLSVSDHAQFAPASGSLYFVPGKLLV